MLFKQLIEADSSTYTYLIAARPGGEAILIDPVRDHVDAYARLFEEQLESFLDTSDAAEPLSAYGYLFLAREAADAQRQRHGYLRRQALRDAGRGHADGEQQAGVDQ